MHSRRKLLSHAQGIFERGIARKVEYLNTVDGVDVNLVKVYRIDGAVELIEDYEVPFNAVVSRQEEKTVYYIYTEYDEYGMILFRDQDQTIKNLKMRLV